MAFRPLHDRILIRRIEAGDRVLFGKWSGTEIALDGQDLLIMKENRRDGSD